MGSLPSSKADTLFALQSAYETFEAKLLNEILSILGIDLDAPEDWPFDDFTHDWYDKSFELKGCKLLFKPTAEQAPKLLDLGFLKFWCCYVDGSERLWCKDGDPNGYPHKPPAVSPLTPAEAQR